LNWPEFDPSLPLAFRAARLFGPRIEEIFHDEDGRSLGTGIKMVSATGGARIGWANATWPFAKLVASARGLRLSGLLGTYNFQPGDVVSLERYGSIPLFSSGIRIVHVRPEYPSKIVFWCSGPTALIEEIQNAGFSPDAPPIHQSLRRRFPVRWTFILFFLLVWNGALLLGDSFDRIARVSPLPWLSPLLMAFMICWGIRVSRTLQKLVLRDNHFVKEIEAYLRLIQFVSGPLLAIFTVLMLAHVFP
jgi:hypothetical protein